MSKAARPLIPLDQLPLPAILLDESLEVTAVSDRFVREYGMPSLAPPAVFTDFISPRDDRGHARLQRVLREPLEGVAQCDLILSIDGVKDAPSRCFLSRYEADGQEPGDEPVQSAGRWLVVLDRRELDQLQLYDFGNVRRRLRAIITSLGDGVLVLDEAGRILEFNDEALALFQLRSADGAPASPESLVGRRLFEFASPVFTDSLTAAIETGAKNLTGRTSEVLQIDHRYIELNVTPLHEGTQGFIGTCISTRDRTDQRIAEVELSQKSSALEATLENMRQGVLMFDGEHRLSVVNQTSLAILGLTAKQLEPGQPLQKILELQASRGGFGPGEAQTQVRERMAIARRGERHRVERVRDDGTTVEVRWEPTPDGGWIIIFTDVTELKTRERELSETVKALAEARDQALAATRSKSRFLASMSHELRTPLNAIIGLTEMLIEEADEPTDPDTTHADLERVLRAGRHLLFLINDLLDLSKIEAGRIDLHPEQTDLARLSDEALATVASMAERNNNQVTLELNGCEETISLDRSRVSQVLLNLLSNACKFTRDGKVLLSCRHCSPAPSDGDPRRWACFEVTDTGPGMSPEELGHVFEEFWQAGDRSDAHESGSGLGLAITRQLCLAMGGTIDVRSVVGEGTTVEVRLPELED